MPFLDENIGWIAGAFGVLVTVIALYVLPAIANQRKRKILFDARPAWSFDQWYQEFYGDEGPDRELARRLIEVIGKELKIEPTRVYPTDRFDKELKLPWWGTPADYFEDLDFLLSDFEEEKGEKIPAVIEFGETVGEVIEQLTSIFDMEHKQSE